MPAATASHQPWPARQLFADLLQLELRNTAAGELSGLHAAAGWYAGHGHPVEAVRHAQAAQDWGLAARLLADHWFGLVFNGQRDTRRELLTRFPADVVMADAELTAMMAAEGSALLEDAPLWRVHACLLEAITRDRLDDARAARGALEQALDLAAPERLLLPFVLEPAPELLERHRRHGTAHGPLISDILNLLSGGPGGPGEPRGYGGTGGPPIPGDHRGVSPRGLTEPFSQAETRVLRYLPTNLTVPEIAGQLYLSVNTIRTHMRHIYDKLGAHRRHEAVDLARGLGLLAPSTRSRTSHPASGLPRRSR